MKKGKLILLINVIMIVLSGCLNGKKMVTPVTIWLEDQTLYPTEIKYNTESNPLTGTDEKLLKSINSSLLGKLNKNKLLLDSLSPNYFVGIEYVDFHVEQELIDEMCDEYGECDYTYDIVEYSARVNLFDNEYRFLTQIIVNGSETEQYNIKNTNIEGWFWQIIFPVRVKYKSERLTRKIENRIVRKFSKDISNYIYNYKFKKK